MRSGRIGEPAAIDVLAASLSAKDDIVRRQVAMPLGRIDRDAVVPHLMKLRRDKWIAVAEVATEAMRRWEERLGQRQGTKLDVPAGEGTEKKIMPARRTLAPRPRNRGASAPAPGLRGVHGGRVGDKIGMVIHAESNFTKRLFKSHLVCPSEGTKGRISRQPIRRLSIHFCNCSK